MEISAAEEGQSPGQNASRSPSPLGNWRRWLRPAVFVVYGLFVIGATLPVILDITDGASEKNKVRIIMAGVAFLAVVVSIAISAWSIINHVMCFTRPAVQKYIISILVITPVYQLSSWLTLRFPDLSVYLDIVRHLYQAFVIYNFVFYLLTFFEEVPNFDNRLVIKPQVKYPPPLCFLKVVPSKRMIGRCKIAILSYMGIRIVCSIIAISTNIADKFEEGNLAPKWVFLWVTIVLTAAQICTIFTMVFLRKAFYEELEMLPRSTSQMVAVLLVVFADNFQFVFLSILATDKALEPKEEWKFVGDVYQFTRMIQDFLVCFEMVILAAILLYAFDYQRYNTGNIPRQSRVQVTTNIGIGETSQQNGNSVTTEQPRGTSPVILQNDAPSTEDAERPRRRKAGHQSISLPDIILNHQDDENQHIAAIHGSPQNKDHGESNAGATQDVDTQNQDGGAHETKQDVTKGMGNIENQVGLELPEIEVTDDGFRDDASGDTDEFLDDEFLTDEDFSDDDDDLGLPADGRLDAPRAAAASQKRRVKKVSYAGMTFDDLDVSKLKTPKKRAKKVSYAGMTFDDMDWERMRSHRSPTMDSEKARTVSSIVEQNEELRDENEEKKDDNEEKKDDNEEKKDDNEGKGFGTSDA